MLTEGLVQGLVYYFLPGSFTEQAEKPTGDWSLARQTRVLESKVGPSLRQGKPWGGVGGRQSGMVLSPWQTV